MAKLDYSALACILRNVVWSIES